MGEVQNVMPQSPWKGLPSKAPIYPVNPDPAAQTYDDIQRKLQAYGIEAQQVANNNALTNIGMQKSLNEVEPQVDYSPLMGLADSWANQPSHLAQSYKAPASNKELIAKLQAELDKNQANLSEQQVQLLKTQLETAGRKEDRKDARENTRAIRELARSDAARREAAAAEEKKTKHLEAAQKGLQSDPVLTEVRKKLSGVDELKRNLEGARTNASDRKQLAQTIAKLKLGGQISDKDVEAFSGGGPASRRLDQWIEDMKTGTLTEENYQDFKQIIDGMEQNARKNQEDIVNLHAAQYAKIAGVPFDEARENIFPAALNKGTSITTGERTKVGEIFTTKDGKKVKFMGGDDNDPANYTEVP